MTDTADVCPRCGDIGSKVSADGNRFHCFNGHEWGLEVEQAGDDPVNAPAHYRQGEVECIDAIRAALGRDGMISYLRGCILKYNWRMLHKGKPLEDAHKLGWYQRRLVETLEGK